MIIAPLFFILLLLTFFNFSTSSSTQTLQSRGIVKCWGENNFGQLGNGNYKDSPIPVTVYNLSDVVQISAGMYHTCALLKNGRVKCWGADGWAQLGNPFEAGYNSTPVTVYNLTDVVEISAGAYHTCALLRDGRVKCWGDNQVGEVGSGSSNPFESIPVFVYNLTNVKEISSGGTKTCALLKDGKVKCWGDGNRIPVLESHLTGAEGIYIISSIYITTHTPESCTCALFKNGRLKCVQGYCYGVYYHDNIPQEINIDNLSIQEIVSTVHGVTHTCFLSGDGRVRCFRYYRLAFGNPFGNTSVVLGNTTNRGVVLVANLTNVTAITAGAYHTCALINGANLALTSTSTSTSTTSTTTYIQQCKKDEAYNPEKKECIKKGIGCYTNDECFNIYKNQSVVCYGSIIDVVTTPGHCCLKDEIWNGSACIKRKLRVVVIPYKEDWSKIGVSERDIEETIGNVFNYYPIEKEKLEVVVWKTPCNPIFDQLWPICPSFVGAAGHGDRYVLVTDKNEDLSSECGTGEAEGCAIVNGVSAIVREFTPTIVAHELGHTFGLQDEYCHYKHPIGGWKCGTEAYPNPLKPEYGCRVFPLPRCENAKLETEKQTAPPGEWIKLNMKDLQGNACEVYKAQIETFKNGNWQPLTTCIPGEPCYVSFSENEKGTNKVRAKLVLAGYTSSYETITNEVEINVEGFTTKPKIFGYSCSDDKLLLNLNFPFTMYWEVYGNGKEIWFRVEKNSNFSYELDGKFEIYDASCNKIGESKVKIEKNGIYNVKVYGPTTSTLLPLSIEKFGFCCWDANVYYPTCFGDKPTTGNGRSIMAYPLQATNFSQPAWEHLKKVMGIWEES